MKLFWCAIAIAMTLAGCNADPGSGRSFAAQVSVPSVHAAVKAAPKPSAAALVLQAVGHHRIVLLGEMHGTQETPALVGQLVSHYAAAQIPVVLGLEVDHNEQPAVDRYLASSGDAQARRALLAGEQWRAPFDGRDSEAMFELVDHVRQLRTTGANVRIMYFDDADTDMNRRNRHMADTLRAAAAGNPKALLLVLTGNVHAMTRKPPGDLYLDGKRIEPPVTMGRDLFDLHPLSIDINAASGHYWACAHSGMCARQAVRPQAPQVEARMEKAPQMESAWDFSLSLAEFHASMPALESTIAARAGGQAASGH